MDDIEVRVDGVRLFDYNPKEDTIRIKRKGKGRDKVYTVRLKDYRAKNEKNSSEKGIDKKA